jgi:hypothetical protein
MDPHGKVSWLQLETRDGLRGLAELAEIEGVPPGDVDEIRRGKVLANLELRQALGRSGPVELTAAFELGPDKNLIGGVFDIDPAHCPPVINSYQSWLSRQDRRAVLVQ